MPSSQELADALRFLSIDAIEKARSGHPGAPMGMADMAEVLWNRFLKHNPANAHWHNRDRFVLSNGHASMLLYALLHLSGYEVGIDALKDFRQLGSITPGHPEFGVTPGVETTTGPLGQGVATAVGMALAEKILARTFNREGFPVVDHYTYVFLGDGCLMEGISHEAASFAGTHKLGKLIALWDNNGISIDGRVTGWFTDDTPARFKAYGWHVVAGVDGHDSTAVKKAIANARRVKDKPSLICCKTIIGKGAPNKCDSAGCHGSPLGPEEIEATRKALGWKEPPFVIPQHIYAAWDAKAKGAREEKRWQTMFATYAQQYPELAAEYTRRMQGELPAGYAALFQDFIRRSREEGKAKASRVSSKDVLDAVAPALPELLGGSADLTGSVGTRWKGSEYITAEDVSGRYLSYGVREFGMGAVMNGLALHGGFIPYGGTFLVFADYAKNAVRLAALMRRQVIWVLTHDSIMMGEDGPTHQPVEQLGMLRLTPHIDVWRPCDAVETAVAWQSALERKDGPACLCLSRQDLPLMQRTDQTVRQIAQGAYIVKDCRGTPEIILIATGSEVALALEAAANMEQKFRVRVVSMPCTEVFARQSRDYQDSVLPPAVRARVAVEAAASDWWHTYVGLDGAVVGMTGFGDSAPGPTLYAHFGFTAAAVEEAAAKTLQACRAGIP